MIRRALLARLYRLEHRKADDAGPELVIVTESIDEDRRTALAPGERIVLDYYRRYGFLSEAVERITGDPADQGRRCPLNGILTDVVERLERESGANQHRESATWPSRDEVRC